MVCNCKWGVCTFKTAFKSINRVFEILDVWFVIANGVFIILKRHFKITNRVFEILEA
jgi:hypothetical protein